MINKALITRRVVKRFLAFACASIMCVNMLGCGKLEDVGSKPENMVENYAPTPEQKEPEEIMAQLPGERDLTLDNMDKWLISEASYPEIAPCPSSENIAEDDYEAMQKYGKELAVWKAEIREKAYKGDASNLNNYWLKSINTMLNDTETENRAYSPVSLYFALGMLSEITDGNSRKQMLDLLGYSNIESFREQAGDIWKSIYLGNGSTVCTLADSIWMNDYDNYKKDTLDTIAKYYYASSFSGKAGTEEYNQVFRKWINENTNYLLKDSVEKLFLEPDLAIALASTIYYKAAWEHDFYKSSTKEDTFKGADGDTNCEFMNGTESTLYFKCDDYQFASKSMKDGAGKVWFILPDETSSVKNVLESGDAINNILTGKKFESKDVNFKLPKFDVTANIKLIDKLKELGIEDVFESEKADFSPIMDESDGLAVDKAEQAIRIIADEKGVEAAAYTVIMIDKAMMAEPDPVNMTLDRPFIFMITSEDNFPLFVGTINSMK